MNIKVALNKKSIDQAIQKLNTAKKQLQNEMLDELLQECYDYFTMRANYYIMQSTVGDDVVSSILNGWKLTKHAKGISIENTSNKAVFVEFGVGIVGEQNSHPNANQIGNNWQYNIPTPYKRAGKYHDENTWRFYAMGKWL